MNFKKIILFLIIMSLFACKSNKEVISRLLEEKDLYDRYADEFKNNTYYNKDLGLKIKFLKNWFILPNFENFDDLQKKYARYFSSEYGEVLFVGYNEEKKLGIRCTVEKLDLDNKDYIEKLKTTADRDIKEYRIKFLSQEDVVLKNIEALRSVFETVLNNKNIFIFDSILFRFREYNYKIDMWCKKSLYEANKDDTYEVFRSVDFSIDDDKDKSF